MNGKDIISECARIPLPQQMEPTSTILLELPTHSEIDLAIPKSYTVPFSLSNYNLLLQIDVQTDFFLSKTEDFGITGRTQSRTGCNNKGKFL